MERKSLALADVQFKLEGDGGTFSGYASTFGNVDSYGDTIIKGAYAETLKTNGMPKMFFNHNSYAVPIGKWVKALEDDYGLLLTGEFTPGNVQAQEVRAALKHGTLDSMSIGYSLTKGDYDETTSGRTIKKVARLPETSIVTFPADKFARVDLSSVKAFADEIAQVATIRDFEYFLRDAGNFSKGAAQALTARAKALFSLRDAGNDDEAKGVEAAIIARIQRIGQ
jgi:HK97 family phage prohead protease